MDTCQDKLLIAAADQSADFFHHLSRPSAAHATSDIRDHAVGTELITAILDLNKSPRVFTVRHKVQLVVLPHTVDIRDSGLLSHLPVPKILIQYLRQAALLVVSYNYVNCGIRGQPLSGVLHVAAGSDNDSVGVHLFGFVQHLPRLPVSDIGDGTCVDHVNVRTGRKIGILIPGMQEALPHRIRLI